MDTDTPVLLLLGGLIPKEERIPIRAGCAFIRHGLVD